MSDVRRVVVEAHYLFDPIPGLEAALDTLKAVAGGWKGARSLQLAMHSCIVVSTVRGPGDADMDGHIGEVSSELARILPNVHELDFGARGQSPVAAALYGRLAGLYAEQLIRLHSDHPITIAYEQQFARLKDVSISGDSHGGYRLPRMNPSTIESLKLTGFHPCHSWTAFATDSNGSDIEFPKLRRLSATYTLAGGGNSVEHPEGGCLRSLRFPALRSLAVRCPTAKCPLLTHAVLPAHVESIDIRAAPDLYQAIAEMPLSATKSIALCVEGSGVSDPDAIAAVCHVLAKSQGCTRKELHVDIVTLPVLPALVTCTDLTALNVLAPTSVDSMLGLITRLPRLAKLVLHRVTFDKIQTDLSVPPRDAYDLIAPLDTQLERLSINPVRQQGVVDAVIQTINYLLLKIPTLGYIDSTHAPKQQVLEFVGDNVWRYPHLAHVNLNLSSA